MTTLQQEIINDPVAVVTALAAVFPELLEPRISGGDNLEIEETPRIVDFDKQAEIVGGRVEIKEVPGLRSSGVATRIAIEIGIYLKTNRSGRLYGSDATFTTIDGNERMADVAFVSNDKLQRGEPVTKADFAPDLAVEVISPTDKQEAVTTKINEYLAAGVREVWRVEPTLKTMTVYKSLDDIKIYTRDQALQSEDVLPGFNLALKDIFID